MIEVRVITKNLGRLKDVVCEFEEPHAFLLSDNATTRDLVDLIRKEYEQPGLLCEVFLQENDVEKKTFLSANLKDNQQFKILCSKFVFLYVFYINRSVFITS